MSLESEIKACANKIFRESYQMSIGELINLYRDEEIDIHPEFQRLFRWSSFQKTRLIESIMLNIPIPPIFVSQNEEGIWDVIDGVQRLSTILQFIGILKDENGKEIEPLTLERTDYLPSFDGVQWNGSSEEKSFTREQKLVFKRSRVDVIIMKKESDPNTKYELFQRLNTGGTKLSDQEVRNCLMIMANRNFYSFIKDLSEYSNFVECVPLTDRKTEEKYYQELVLRLIIANNYTFDELNKYSDLSELLDKETLNLCEKDLPLSEIKDRFERTFDLLREIVGEDSFRKFSGTKHSGPFMVTSYQAIATGIFSNIDSICNQANYQEIILNKIREFYSTKEFENNTAPGTRSIMRFYSLTRFGKEYFHI